MALVEKKVCDVYGTTKDVQHYKIVLIQSVEGEDDIKLLEGEVDLCPRAYGRFIGWLKRGMNPPPQNLATYRRDAGLSPPKKKPESS